MPLDAEAILALRLPDRALMVSDRDVMLFALSIGLGADPLDGDELPFVHEDGLRVFPSFFTVLGHPGPWWRDPSLRVTRHMLVQGAQRLEILGRLEPGRMVTASNRVLEVVDKGVDSGAIVVMERMLRDQATGAPLARLEGSTFCRADGGFGPKARAAHAFVPAPARPPDWTRDMSTTPRQALFFRLHGDRNALHASPAAAARAGYARPILHGLCTLSLAVRALLRSHVADGALRAVEARFRGPVYPGETVRIAAWQVAGGVSFNATVPERDSVVLDRGWAAFVTQP